MKKILLFIFSGIIISGNIVSQDDTNKKFRAGLKVSAQPCWFTSNDANTAKSKTGFGYGFGLVLDFRLSDVIYFSTGIGGDFENASVKYRNDGYDPLLNPTAFCISYTSDNSNALVESENGKPVTELFKEGSSTYIIRERQIKTTHITLPLSLKMLTKEYGGFRYFGQFGGDIGFRTVAKANDSYDYKLNYTSTGGVLTAEGTTSNLNIRKDCSLIPIRVGLNVGVGTEYRIAGSTSLFLSVNYFRSFTNLMRKDSKYMNTGSTYDLSNNTVTFTHLQQHLIMSAIKINIGVMF